MNEKKLGFGLMRLPLLDPNDSASIDIEQCKKMTDIYMERGFNYFDTAWMYHKFCSESAVKEFLTSRYPREAYTVTTKLHADFIETREDVEKTLQSQLEKTGLEYFDYYWIHDMTAARYEKYEKLDCFKWVQELKAKGITKHIGFSFHDKAELLDRILTEHPEMEYVQLQINYLDWESHAIESRKCYEVATKHGKPVIVMEPVKGGTLAKVPAEVEKMFKAYDPDASVSSWAIRFAASLPNVCMVLSGMSNIDQMLDNTSYMQDLKPLNDEELAIIDKARTIISESVFIPCTACEYCVSGCPMNIDIPKYFAIYNKDKQEMADDWEDQSENYRSQTKLSGKASDCIACGQCEGICPQHLHVIDHLKTIVRHFE